MKSTGNRVIIAFMGKKTIPGPQELANVRRFAAADLIRTAGGPAELARLLTGTMGVTITPARVTKWAVIGVPPAWGPILEAIVPGCRRQALNPWLYTDYQQDIHNPGIEYLVNI